MLKKAVGWLACQLLYYIGHAACLILNAFPERPKLEPIVDSLYCLYSFIVLNGCPNRNSPT
jgi:hypothetical protein